MQIANYNEIYNEVSKNIIIFLDNTFTLKIKINYDYEKNNFSSKIGKSVGKKIGKRICNDIDIPIDILFCSEHKIGLKDYFDNLDISYENILLNIQDNKIIQKYLSLKAFI